METTIQVARRLRREDMGTVFSDGRKISKSFYDLDWQYIGNDARQDYKDRAKRELERK